MPQHARRRARSRPPASTRPRRRGRRRRQRAATIESSRRERHEPFEDERYPAELGRCRARHRQANAVRLDLFRRIRRAGSSRLPGGRACRLPVRVTAIVDRAERHGRDADRLKRLLLGQPVLRHLERPRRRKDQRVSRQPRAVAAGTPSHSYVMTAAPAAAWPAASRSSRPPTTRSPTARAGASGDGSRNRNVRPSGIPASPSMRPSCPPPNTVTCVTGRTLAAAPAVGAAAQRLRARA